MTLDVSDRLRIRSGRLYIRKRTDGQPSRKRALRLHRAVRAQTTRVERAGEWQVPAPQVDHVGQRGIEEEIDTVIRCREAQLAPPGFVQEPPTALFRDLVGEGELNDSSVWAES